MRILSSRIVGALTRVRPEERAETVGAFLVLCGFMAGHALLETARDALFLARIPAAQLPWAYLAIAAGALALSRRPPQLLRRIRARHELAAWLMFAAVVTLGFWVLTGVAGDWVFYLLYVWTGVLATLVVVRFWTGLAGLFTLTQAKRVYAVIGSGSVVGAIGGTALARVITEMTAARHVVAAAAGVFFLTALAPALLARAAGHAPSPGAADRPAEPWDVRAVGRWVWDRAYLRRVLLLVATAIVTFTLVDFVFKSVVADVVPDEELGEFFASVYLSLNLLSLIVQVAAVPWLVRRLGVPAAVSVVPLLLVLASGGFAVAGGLGLVLLLKMVDGSLRHSLYRTGTELLSVPIPGDVRPRVKAFIDVVGQRGGQALASLVILLSLLVTRDVRLVAAGAVAAALCWLLLARGLRPHYLDVFRETLDRDIVETRIAFPALDAASVEGLVEALNDPDDRRVLAALELLAGEQQVRAVPALLLHHPSSRVVERALDLFARAGREDALPVIERLLEHEDPGRRAAALRAHTTLRPDAATLARGLADPDDRVRATALAGGLALGGLAEEAEREALVALRGPAGSAARIAFARAAALRPDPALDPVLVPLAQDPDGTVRLATVAALRAAARPALIPTLVGLLGERSLREEVRGALVAGGPAALRGLAVALRDGNVPHEIRRHIPHTVAGFGTPEAATLLLEHLQVEEDGMIRFKVLRALGRLRTEHPALPLDDALLGAAIDWNVGSAFQLLAWRQVLEAGADAGPARRTPAHEALVELLRDKERHALERLFRLLNLRTGTEEFLRVHRALYSGRREAVAGARELVEHLLYPPLRRRIVRVVDDLFDPSPAVHGGGDAGAYDEVLATLAGGRAESLRALAAYHRDELARAERVPA